VYEVFDLRNLIKINIKLYQSIEQNLRDRDFVGLQKTSLIQMDFRREVLVVSTLRLL